MNGLPEEASTDPLDYLTQHATTSLENAKMLAHVAMAARSGKLEAADALVLEQMVQARATAERLLFEGLKRDGRLPEGVRVLLAELAVAHEAVAAVLSWQIRRS